MPGYESAGPLNYYEHHLGDFARDTGHLSALEHGIYRLLLDWYYAAEKPIPDAQAARLARSPREAVLPVLEEFFVLDGLVWRHKRVEAEIANYRARIEAASRAGKKSAAARAALLEQSFNDRSTAVERPFNEQATHQTPITRHQSPEDQKLSALRAEVGTKRADRVPAAEIISLYHEKLPMLAKVEKLTPARRGYLRQRWAEDLPTLEAWGNFFDDVAGSAFLTGRAEGRGGAPPFRADLEWLTRPGNFAKIAEGKYHR